MGSGPFVVVSGLPASGKTTVGTLLSERLGLPLLDKDVILEALFDTLGSPDSDARTRLSRASDDVLFQLAEQSTSAVLVSWWHHETAPARLVSLSPDLVEVFCDCPVELAVMRFEARTRHPGHHDPARSPAEVEEHVHRMREAFRGPLQVGRLVRIDTSVPLGEADLVRRVQEAISEVRGVGEARHRGSV